MWKAYSSPLAQSCTDHTGQHIRVCPVEISKKEEKKIEDVVGGRGTKGYPVDACALPQTVTVLLVYRG